MKIVCSFALLLIAALPLAGQSTIGNKQSFGQAQAIGAGRAAAGNTFTVVHHPSVVDTTCTTTASCASPVPSTGSGNLLYFTAGNTNGTAWYITAVGNAACTASATPSACCTGNGTGACGTGAVSASSQTFNASIGSSSSGYILSSVSGLTTIPLKFTSSGNYNVTAWEESYTPGPISLDICNTASNTSNSTSQTGPSLAASTGTSDAAFQSITLSTGDPSSITSYQNIVFTTNTHAGAADLINTSAFGAPTWTTSNAQSVMTACSIK